MRLFGLLGLIMGIILYILIYRKNKDVFQPTSLMMIIWWVGAFIASLKLAPFQHEWSYKTMFCIFITGFILYLITISKIPYIYFRINKKKKNTIDKSFLIIIKLFFFFCLICTLYISFYVRKYGIRSESMDQKTMAISLVRQMNPIIQYGHMLLPYYALCAIFALLYGPRTIKNRLFFIISFLYATFYFLIIIRSRDNLTSFLFGSLFLFAKKEKWNLSKAVRIMLLAIIGLSVFVIIRVDSQSAIYNGIFNHPFLNATYNYFASSYENLNSIINNKPINIPLANTFVLFYKLLGIYDENTMLSGKIYTVYGIYNSSPMIGGYYFDLGILGIFFGVTFIGVILKRTYQRSRHNIYYILFLSMFMKGVFTTPLGDNIINHGSFNALVGYLILFIICLYAQRSRHIVSYGKIS